MSAERTWTGNSEVDAAIVMLDRIDCSPEDDSRVDEVEATLRRLHARNQELEKDLGNAKRLTSKIWDKHPEARETIEEGTGAWLVFGQDVETGGVSAQRVTQQAHLTERGIFIDEGAIALYAAPQPQADGRCAGRYLDYLIRNQAQVRNNLDEYEVDEDCADCGYWLEFTDSNSQRWVQIGVFKTPRDAIDAAIAANKEKTE